SAAFAEENAAAVGSSSFVAVGFGTSAASAGAARISATNAARVMGGFLKWADRLAVAATRRHAAPLGPPLNDPRGVWVGLHLLAQLEPLAVLAEEHRVGPVGVAAGEPLGLR